MVQAADKMNYYEAQDYCTGLGTNLATLSTQEEIDEAADWCGSNLCMIGLRTNLTSEWVWRDGRDFDSSITDWTPNEPSSFFWGTERCMHINMAWPAAAGRWVNCEA